MELWIATSNRGKLNEFKLLFEKELPQIKILSLADFPTYSSPPENGQSFLDNARIKARSLKAMKPNTWVMAEDSGLEVEGLGNLPGIHSARYAGPKAADSENVAKLLKMIQIRSSANRAAQFQCCMVVFNPQGEEMIFNGVLKGQIAKTTAGQHGFGYDPVFIPENETKTLAELGMGYKNKHSHRASATAKFIEKLKASL
ncbi:MAG: non-canonical purine NTP pyrophosphatase, RdgB/HAM1 family [Bdellovibrio sp. CG10_big_fil_rev_8_21_14_0_10_47_8]|nr:MAG: non-canonical purine NTP pyrophosphatase, RdgB/HAM1 family [Bdellovibrio sp. CG10_big_fil_rev_8_21_14_0_10_47_8]